MSEIDDTHSLGVNLANVGQSLGEDVGRHLVSKLVAELGSLALGSLGKRSGIGNGASDYATHRGRNLEDV